LGGSNQTTNKEKPSRIGREQPNKEKPQTKKNHKQRKTIPHGAGAAKQKTKDKQKKTIFTSTHLAPGTFSG
jgi:hypothetical protein